MPGAAPTTLLHLKTCGQRLARVPPPPLHTVNLMLLIAILLVLAWKTAGYIGADYVLLRWLGVPWQSREPEQTPTPGIKLAPALE